MATALLTRSLRSVISKGIIEKRLAPMLSTELFNGDQQTHRPFRESQFSGIMKRMFSERKIHQNRLSPNVRDSTDVDSDSDNEQQEERGQTPFWRRKMRTLHSHLDVNKDGVISYDDFMLLADRFSELGHLTPEGKKEFKKVLKEMWEEQWGEVTPYNLITVEKYLEEMHHVLNDPSLKKKCHNFLPFLFKAVDKDQSGEISVEEFKLFFECLGLTHDHAIVSFSYIDTNEDGKISLNEFVTLGRDFFLTEDHTRPSKHFWGPLVD